MLANQENRDLYPLGEVSHLFAGVDQSPEPGDVAEITENALADFSVDTAAPMLDRQLTVADLTYAHNFLLFAQSGDVKPGQNLLRAIEGACEDLAGRPPFLTYDDVIMVNPFEDPTTTRTFTSGSVGESEAQFYKKHLEIEEAMEPGTQQLQGLHAAIENGRYTEADIERTLYEVANGLRVLVRNTTYLAEQMQTADFHVFKQYFDQPNDVVPGPSGLFSHGVALTELVTSRAQLQEQGYFEKLSPNLEYFALSHRDQIKSIEADDDFISLHDHAESNGDAALTEMVGSIEKKMAAFRRMHFQAVARHIPADVSVGSAGTEIDAFLLDRAQMSLSGTGPKDVSRLVEDQSKIIAEQADQS